MLLGIKRSRPSPARRPCPTGRPSSSAPRSPAPGLRKPGFESAPALGLVLIATLLSGCAGGADPGTLLVVQDKYMPFTCDEIAKERAIHARRERQLSVLWQKAEAAPGGAIVSTVAYSTELANVRSELRATDRALQAKDCPPPVEPTQPELPPPAPPPRRR